MIKILRMRIDITGEMYDRLQRYKRSGNSVDLIEKLDGRFFSLRALTRDLLLIFVTGDPLVDITLTLTAAAGLGPVNAKIFGDVVPVDLKLNDQAPLAEGLERDQQYQEYGNRDF